MKKFFLFFSLIIMIGVAASCSDDSDDTEVTSIFDGTFSGDNLQFLLDGTAIEGAIVSVKLDSNQENATVVVKNVEAFGGTVTWTAPFNVSSQSITGNYTAKDGTSYAYTIAYAGIYGYTASCTVQCNTVGK